MRHAHLMLCRQAGSSQTLTHSADACIAGKPLVVRFQSDAGTGGLLDAVDRLSPLPSELPGGPGWTGGIPRPALSPSDSDNVRRLATP